MQPPALGVAEKVAAIELKLVDKWHALHAFDEFVGARGKGVTKEPRF